MRRRKLVGVLVALCFFGPIVAPVHAGGWATIELAQPVENAVVGNVVAFNIVVLQHGRTPADYDRVVVTALHAESGDTQEIEADATGESGSYLVEIIFDQAGRWKIRADVPEFRLGSAFPTVYVYESVEEATIATKAKSSEIEVVEVNIIGGFFAPSLVTVSSGGTVRFTNDDAIKHEVAFADIAIDDSGILETGESFEITFESAGEFFFVCGPHPGMNGWITVEE